MLTRSGKELNNLAELVDYYKKCKDGLDVLLLRGCTALDPPELPPTGYVNLIHRAKHTKAAATMDLEDDYENSADILDDGSLRS